MSSNEDDYNDNGHSSTALSGLKKRRIQRACDICRRKKSDGVQMPGNRCSNCIAYNYECSYIEAAKSLENRVEKLDKLLRRLCPNDQVYKELTASLEKDNFTFERIPLDPSSLVGGPDEPPRPSSSNNPVETVTSAMRRVAGHDGINHDDDLSEDDKSTLILADNLKQLAIDSVQYRFFGKSSSAMLIQTAIELKNEYTGSDIPLPLSNKTVLGNKRAEFWEFKPWESRIIERKTPLVFHFPDDDLYPSLVDFYFTRINIYLPVLHRPSFERSIAEGYHHVNEGFATIFLLVCAVGARFSDDKRVFLENVDSTHSCGWKWFDQVQASRRNLLHPPTLYDLQFYCLAVQFLQGSSAPQSCWTMVGIGIRQAQDVGAHRRKVHNRPHTVEDELWKRAFWVLVSMDKMVSAALGRPCAIQDEDFDLDLPIECDDEYWEHPDPEQRFKQPKNKPSVVTAFVLNLKLQQILGFSLRTIYAINKSKILLGLVGQQWEQHIVAELDSALNKWVDSVPDHLRWDPNREDPLFFNQSVMLYATYYHIQILVHRPFIPSPSKPSPLSFPSLAICTNAARSCSHVLDIQRKRFSSNPVQLHMATFTAAIVLLLSIWGGKRSGLSTDPKKEMADVHKCMQILRHAEDRWHSAGRLWDILFELASVGDLPLPQPSPPTTHKRSREDSEAPNAQTPSDVASAPAAGTEVRTIAGARRAKESENKRSNLAQGVNSLAGEHMQHHISMSQPQSSQSTRASSRMSSQASLRDMHPPSRHSPQSIVMSNSPNMADTSQSNNPSRAQGGNASFLNPTLYNLPVYSNELASLPLHGQVTFATDASSTATSSTSEDHTSSRSTSSDINFWHNSQHYSQMSESSTSLSSSIESHRVQQSQQFDPGAMGQGYGVHNPSAMVLDPMMGQYQYQTNELAPVFGMQGQRMPHLPLGMQDTNPAMGMPTFAYPQRPIPPQMRQEMHGHQLTSQGGSIAGPDGRPGNFGCVDNGTMAMWSNAPTGFELDEWDNYLTNVSEMSTSTGQGQPASNAPVPGGMSG
ncbi:fungal-specific transcription factor domain-containing protein [Panaeolus papilionaceus]|nr:fungal-specific transcription factor domain-containing protein [Panaeolus papilionaceus]